MSNAKTAANLGIFILHHIYVKSMFIFWLPEDLFLLREIIAY